MNRGFGFIQNAKKLLLVSFRVGLDLGARELRARFRFAGRVADLGGEVADDEMRFVTQILPCAQLAEYYREAQMNIGRSWIQAQLDAQRFLVALRLLQF